jgi:hypothetical protein
MGSPIKNQDNSYITADQDFVRLIQVIKEEPEIRQTLRPILELDNFNRKSALHTWLEELRLKKAPLKFKKILSHLLDDEIARKTLEIIRGGISERSNR